MSDYNARVLALEKFGMQAAGRLAETHKELFLSIPVKDAFEKIVALTRMRDAIEPPKSEQEAYKILESLLAEMLYDGRLKVPAYGLSQVGRASFDYLVGLHENPNPTPKTPQEQYADVVKIYKTDMQLFQERRAQDPEFLRRSNIANELHLF
jgi:hypothetical protein